MTSWGSRLATVVTEHSWTVVAVMLLTTAVFAVGMGNVEESSSISGISEDSRTANAYEAVQTDFSTRDANTTTTVIAVRAEDGNVLSKDSLLRTLRYQRTLRNNETLAVTLVDDQPTVGVANVVATVAMGEELEDRAERLQTALETVYAHQLALSRWHVASERGEVDADTYRERTDEIERSIADAQADATANLSDDRAERFNASADRLREITRERSELDVRYRRGDLSEERYASRVSALEDRTAAAFRDGTLGVFEERLDTLEDPDRQPPLDEQIAQLESMDDEEVSAVVGRVVDPERASPASRAAYRLLPRSYEPGSTAASARLVVVTQETDGVVRAAPAISEEVSGGQVAARSLAQDQPGPETYLFASRGLLGTQQENAIGDSLAVLGPLALAFVLVSLSLAYRDPVDVVLGLAGVVVVLVWTVGAMGWLGIPFGQTLIAAPILLVGLSVDYAFHLVMRYREERARADDGVQPSMARALLGVGPALALVTMTTGIGFLANLTSPLGGVRDFALVTAIGITATLFVFGLFVPAGKTAVAAFLERRGWGGSASLPGSGGRAGRLLEGGTQIAERAPLSMVLLVVLLTGASAAGAAQVEVSTSQELFMADDPPAWTEELPEPVQPGEYFLKENRQYLHSEFQSPDQQGYVLVEGNVTAPGTLERVAAAQRVQTGSDVVQVTAGGDPAVDTPVSAMQEAAERNETFGATLAAADSDGDGIPDENLTVVYDAFYEAAPDLAAGTVHRTDDGEYAALRLRMAVDGDASQDATVATLTEAAGEFEGSDEVRATATGIPVIETEDTDRVATSMVKGLAVTLVVVLALLVAVFRMKEGSAALGVLTLVPVTFTISWLLGTMALLDFPISPVTALVGSISVGLGVDYAIHVSERFAQERTAGTDVETAIRRTVTGTGSAMVSSAVTTAAGFGVLSFALLPALRQFGIVLALGVVYAFLATVYVQPSLLTLWERYSAGSTAGESSVVAGDD